MASEVDICNLALGHLGDRATVSSISPPEGSAQAEHCQRFYPVARDLVLEAHEWGFATKRATLALLSATAPPGFEFVYQMPADCRNIIDLINPNIPSYYPVTDYGPRWELDAIANEPIPYEMEVLTNGTQVIYTNLEDAQIRYVASITDTTKFSAQVVDAIAWLLAAYLAGPVIKGDAGMTVSKGMMQGYLTSLALARTSDANNRRRTPAQAEHAPSWIQYR